MLSLSWVWRQHCKLSTFKLYSKFLTSIAVFRTFQCWFGEAVVNARCRSFGATQFRVHRALNPIDCSSLPQPGGVPDCDRLTAGSPLEVMLLQFKRAEERQQVAFCQVRQVLIKSALDLYEGVQRVVIVQVELRGSLRPCHRFPHCVQCLFQTLQQPLASQLV